MIKKRYLLKINYLYSDETDDYIDNDANEELSRICTLPEELDFYGKFWLNSYQIMSFLTAIL